MHQYPLPDGWTWTTLGQACQVNPTMQRPEGLTDQSQVSFVPMSAVDAVTGSIVASEPKPLAEVWRGYKRFAEGDVIFARITPCMENGKTAIARDLLNGIGLGSTEFHVLRPREAILAQWVFYFVRQHSFRESAAAAMTGTAGQLRVSSAFLEEALVPLPPLSEQRRLVARIDALLEQSRSARQALERIPTLLQKLRQAVLSRAFRGELTERDPGDEPAGVLVERIRAERRRRWEEGLRERGKEMGRYTYEEPAAPDTSGLPELPEGWVWTTVGQLAEVATGATPLRRRSEFYTGGTVPWVTSGTLNELYIDHADEMITHLALAETNVKVFPAGTLLVAMYGEGQTRGRVSELKIDAATNQACAALIFQGPSSTCKPYVKLFFQKNYEDIRRLSSGGVQPNLSLSIIRRQPLPLPPLAEQERIVAHIHRVFVQADAVEIAVNVAGRRLDKLEQAVLARAFRGELVGHRR